MLVTVDVEIKLAWDNMIGRFFDSGDWGAFVFKRKTTMPILPCPFDYIPSGPEWILPLCIESWSYADDKYELWATAKTYRMGEAKCKQEVEDVVDDMLANGWEREWSPGPTA